MWRKQMSDSVGKVSAPIRQATQDDLASMVDLSEIKRSQYEVYQPLFWRKAKDSRERQTSYFESQLRNRDVAIFVHTSSNNVDGFIIANLGNAQECNVDDFALADESHWESTGRALLAAAGEEAKRRGVNHYLVVCAHLDSPKRRMLSIYGLEIARYWYTAAIQPVHDLSEEVGVRRAVASDAARMAEIAKTPGRKFAEIGRDQMVVSVCERGTRIVGYAIAAIVSSPPVYDPGGATLLVIESAMAQSADWQTAGKSLLQAIQSHAAQQGAIQYVVVCNESQRAQRDSLEELGLRIASEWYGGAIQ
jgi:GNAT superfamily N-acetyltransferase